MNHLETVSKEDIMKAVVEMDVRQLLNPLDPYSELSMDQELIMAYLRLQSEYSLETPVYERYTKDIITREDSLWIRTMHPVMLAKLERVKKCIQELHQPILDDILPFDSLYALDTDYEHVLPAWLDYEDMVVPAGYYLHIRIYEKHEIIWTEVSATVKELVSFVLTRHDVEPQEIRGDLWSVHSLEKSKLRVYAYRK